MKFVAGTRSSKLALWQTELVLARLRAIWPDAEWSRLELSTHGDEEREASLADIGGRGAFTEKLEGSLLRGEIDFAVHSLKDLPVESSPELTIAAVVGPRDAGEVLVSRSGRILRELPSGAVVGTSSLRRQAQLLRVRPDLVVRSIRGNVETRVAKVTRGDYDATLLAAAGIERLGLEEHITERLGPETMLPAPGQGAIAVQCRAEDSSTRNRLSAISDSQLEVCTRAERSFLKTLGGGCSAPVAALAVVESRPGRGAVADEDAAGGGQVYRLRGRVVDPGGGRTVEVEGIGLDPMVLGSRLAERALLRGADAILAKAGVTPPPLRPVLAGKRVVVTRPRSQSDEMTAILRRLGAVVLPAPVIRIAALPGSESTRALLNEPGRYRWIVLASTNAVEHFFAALEEGGPRPHGIGERIAVVGPATAAAVEARGERAGFVARGQTGAELGAELPDVAGRHLLLPCAERSTEGLPETLRERGAHVTMLPLYRTEAVPLEQSAIAELEAGADYLLFTSGSTVAAFVDTFRGSCGEVSLRKLFERARVACIGPSTARVVEQNGFAGQIVAEEHTSIGLIEAIVDFETETGDERI